MRVLHVKNKISIFHTVKVPIFPSVKTPTTLVNMKSPLSMVKNVKCSQFESPHCKSVCAFQNNQAHGKIIRILKVKAEVGNMYLCLNTLIKAIIFSFQNDFNFSPCWCSHVF